MNRKILNSLKNKNIILFGCNEETIEFYKTYHEMINIVSCVTNYSENVKLQPLKEWSVETFLYDDMEITQDEYLVICDSEHFQPLERRLQIDGKKEYEQYVSYKLAAGVLEEKKLVTLMGSECIRQLHMAMSAVPLIEKDYMCIYYSESELLKVYKNRMAEYQHIAKCSEIYIFSICDKGMYKAKVLSEKDFFENCLRISISDYSFNGYHPQIINNRDRYSDFLLREKERFEIPYFTLALAREDSNLREYVMKDMPIDEIVKKVSADDFYSKEQIQQNFEQALDNIKKSDKEATIALGDFIRDFCRSHIAYRNLDEWNEDILSYVLKQVTVQMGLDVAIDRKEILEIIEEKTGSELPVYPSVLRHLNICDYGEKKYKVVNYYSTRYLDFQEYIRYCIECMYQAKDLRLFLGIEGM